MMSMDTIETYAGTELRRLRDHSRYELLGVPFMESDGWLLPRRFRDVGEETALLKAGRGVVVFYDQGINRFLW